MATSVTRPVRRLAAAAGAVLVSAVAAVGLVGEDAPASPPPPPVAVAAPSAPPPPPPPPPVPLAVRPGVVAPVPYSPGDPATWSTAQLAAQVVFSCVPAGDLGRAEQEARAGVGGIVVMGRPQDGAALTAALAAVRAAGPDGVAPVVASDEEGGLVQRLRDVLGRLPDAVEMGGWPDERIEQTAFDYGTRMRGLGYAMALSPVADLGVPGGYIARTRRAFSADPARTAAAAAAWARGLGRAGVVPAAKHWPGHGGAADSHDSAPTVPAFAELEGRDLLPFSAVLETGAGVVMVGHLRSDGLTEPGLPATLSPNALRVLRERAGGGTVVVTDSLSMAAASSAVGITPAAAAVRALQAGADWAMVCVDAMGAVDAVRAALDAGGWPRDAAVTAVRRVLGLKQRLGLLATPLASLPPVGGVESAQLVDGVVRLVGTAADPDAAEPPLVRVLVGGTLVGEVRPDPATTRYEVAAPVAPGVEVCLEALDAAGGRSTPLGCTTVP